MRWDLVVGLIVISVALLPSASAQADASLVVEAYDQEEECPEDRTYCYEIESGSLDAVDAGSSLEITLVNEGEIDHELVVAPLELADPEREETSEEEGLGEIAPLEPGEQATATFEIPENATGVYLWCDIGAHEQLGMWRAQSFSEDGAEGGESENGASAPLAGVVVSLLAAALLPAPRPR